ncbi:transposase [Paraburkholderia humisilvae]|uniref:transposase n=1 Tax=Paraburkholderia humisilvae TaxID=627669 RepID=UPI00360A7760
MEQPVSSGHDFPCETEIQATFRSHDDVFGEIDAKESNGVHVDTPMNGNASSYDTPAGAVHTINWVAQADRDAGVRHDGLTTAERQELTRLRRENRHLKMERDILSI